MICNVNMQKYREIDVAVIHITTARIYLGYIWCCGKRIYPALSDLPGYIPCKGVAINSAPVDQLPGLRAEQANWEQSYVQNSNRLCGGSKAAL